MYGFDVTNSRKLTAESLEQVCFGPYDLQLNFFAGNDEGKKRCSFSITCRISSKSSDANLITGNDYKQHAATLLTCLMHDCSYFVEDERTAKLTFTNGVELLLHEDDQYESVVIHYGGQTIVI